MAVLIVSVAGDGAQAARLKEAADIVAADARRRAAAWSRRIPPSVHVAILSPELAVITAGGPPAPMAWTFEAPGIPEGVWHPVFGHGPRSRWHWIRQEPRPFLAPAAEAMADPAAGAFAYVIDDWIGLAGDSLGRPA